jgi:hypothetical protein
MRIYFDGSVNVYMVRIGDGILLGSDIERGVTVARTFKSIAEIRTAYPEEFAESYPGISWYLDVGQGGNVSHRISTVLDGVQGATGSSGAHSGSKLRNRPTFPPCIQTSRRSPKDLNKS